MSFSSVVTPYAERFADDLGVLSMTATTYAESFIFARPTVAMTLLEGHHPQMRVTQVGFAQRFRAFSGTIATSRDFITQVTRCLCSGAAFLRHGILFEQLAGYRNCPFHRADA